MPTLTAPAFLRALFLGAPPAPPEEVPALLQRQSQELVDAIALDRLAVHEQWMHEVTLPRGSVVVFLREVLARVDTPAHRGEVERDECDQNDGDHDEDAHCHVSLLTCLHCLIGY